jgi:hypothetical protein
VGLFFRSILILYLIATFCIINKQHGMPSVSLSYTISTFMSHGNVFPLILLSIADLAIVTYSPTKLTLLFLFCIELLLVVLKVQNNKTSEKWISQKI